MARWHWHVNSPQSDDILYVCFHDPKAKCSVEVDTDRLWEGDCEAKLMIVV